MKSIRPLLFFACAFLALPPIVLAQDAGLVSSRVEQGQRFRSDTTTAQEQSEDARRRLAPAFEDQAPSSPGDPDLGQQVILRKREKATPFSAFVTASGFYTNNAALTNKATVSDAYFVGEAGVSYQRDLAPDLFGEVTLRQAVFRYSKFDELDFDSLNVGAGLTYVLRPIWGVAVSARYNYNRLTDGSEHDEFFKNQTLSLGLMKTFEFSKAHYAYVGYSSILGWSDPVAPQRDEHGVFLGYRANLTRSFSTDFYYRIAAFDYVNNREDLNQTLALSLKWEPIRGLSVSASASLGFNDSDREVFSYHVFNGGGTLAAAIAF